MGVIEGELKVVKLRNNLPGGISNMERIPGMSIRLQLQLQEKLFRK